MRIWSLRVLLVAAVAGALGLPSAAGAGAPRPTVTVMTRNLYLGADLLRLAGRAGCSLPRCRGRHARACRGDHIMAKPALTLVRSFLTGRETTNAGHHPSDHGGLVSILRL